MSVTRREFLATGGAAALATLAPSRLLAAIEQHAVQAPRASSQMSWSQVRAQFLLAPGYLHFASFYIASHPRPVRHAIDSYRLALDAHPFLTVERNMFEAEHENLQRNVCEAVAAYTGGEADQIALTGNTTTSLALVYNGLSFKPGDELLLTTHDHYSHHEAARFAAERHGARTRRVALYERPEDASVDEMVGRLRKAIRPETRTVGVTWVHSSTGVRLPIRELAAAVKEANRGRDEAHRALLVVDGVHGLGAVDEQIADLGCDFFCAGTHKWMFAPRGTGIIWGRWESWPKLRPTIPTFSHLAAYEGWMGI